MTPIVVAGCEHFPLPLRGEIYDNGHRIRLLTPLRFIDEAQNEDIVVPAGFDCDFNSIPRPVWFWFSKWEYPEAGIIHDYLFQHPGKRTLRRCNEIWRRILHLKGCRKSKRLTAWMALSAGSWIPWNRYRQAEA
jgi:hypothetical protein